ncbi:MAG: hypothetical protein AB1656_14420 [Candidatus Omnitrophota bacterium]
MDKANPPLKRRAIVICPFKGAFKVAQPFKAGMRNFGQLTLFAIQKRKEHKNLDASHERFFDGVIVLTA